jgi:triosephosphate isomerase (TIM)
MTALAKRQKFVCGNWKMHGMLTETESLLQALMSQWDDSISHVELCVCPPFTSLATAASMLVSSGIQHGAQNCHFESKGAFTGEISPMMLAEAGCSYVILGHSERRTIFGEKDAEIAKKVKAVTAVGMRAILCIGETLEERDSNKTEKVLHDQLNGSLEGIMLDEMEKVTIAYEPVWAIGTGKTASPQQAQDAHAFIRARLASMYSDDIAASTRILYGGSMNEKNAAELLAQPDLDGGLIGGASLKADSFLAIANAAA